VLDVGCGTGGLAREIARVTGARVVGCDRSERFLEFARALPSDVTWVEANAEQLPFEAERFDRVLHSLVLHQLADPTAAVAEAFRVLRPGGLVLVRTIAPEDIAERVPERYLPAMARADEARLPAIDAICGWLRESGFGEVDVRRHLRNKTLNPAEQEQELRTEARYRYPFLTDEEIDGAVEQIRRDAAAAGEWVDPRPTYLILGLKPS
jgi:ubiquinone/menaquinone biosynthesis C-methylase UbiE